MTNTVTGKTNILSHLFRFINAPWQPLLSPAGEIWSFQFFLQQYVTFKERLVCNLCRKHAILLKYDSWALTCLQIFLALKKISKWPLQNEFF